MPDWRALASSHTLEVEQFPFQSGERSDLTLHCRTLGQPNAAKDNAVLLLHGTTESSLQFLQPDMAEALFKRTQPLDCEKYFLILPDAIGHGESSKPSKTAGTSFPQYSYTDIVNAQHRIVTELFGFDNLRLVLGTSMGGMNTWMWGYLYPAMTKALMPIACLPQKLAGQNLLFRRLILAIIEADGKFRSDDMSEPSLGVGLAWNLFHMLTGSRAKLEQELASPEAADQRIQEVIKKSGTQSPLDVLWEFEASSDYDPAPHLQEITASLLTVNFRDDQINLQGFPALEGAVAKMPRARAVFVEAGEASEGHQTLSKAALWASYVSTILAECDM